MLTATGVPIGLEEVFGLLQTYEEFDFGTVIGGVVTPEGWRYRVIVPILVGYSCKLTPDYQIEPTGTVYGPPINAFIVNYHEGSAIYNPKFGTSTGLIGLPQIAFAAELSPVNGRYTSVTVDDSTITPSGTAYLSVIEGLNDSLLLRFPTAVTVGTSAVVFAGNLPDDYRSYFPTQEDYFDGEWIPMFTNWATYSGWRVIRWNIHTGVIPAYLNIVNGTLLADGTVIFKAIGAKSMHWIHSGRLDHFQGVLMSGGWVVCAGYLSVGSFSVTYDKEVSFPRDLRFVPTGSKVTTWLPYRIFFKGSARPPNWLAIDYGFPIPQVVVTQYVTGSPIAKIFVYDNSSQGSSLFAQACIAYPTYVKNYPDVSGSYWQRVSNLISEFFSLPSFKLMVDANENPFILTPVPQSSPSARTESAFMCDVKSYERLTTTEAHYDYANDRAIVQVEGWKGYKWFGIVFGRDFADTNFNFYFIAFGDWAYNYYYDSLRGFATPWRMLPAWPGDLEYSSFPGEGLPTLDWSESMFLRFNEGDVIVDENPSLPEPQIPLQPDRDVEVIYPAALIYMDIWRLNKDVVGSLYPDAEPSYHVVAHGEFDRVKMVPTFVGTFTLDPIAQFHDWRYIMPEFRRQIFITRDPSRHGHLQSAHLRIDYIVSETAISAWLRKLHRMSVPTPFGNSRGVLANVQQCFPQTFYDEEQIWPADSRVPIIIGRFWLVRRTGSVWKFHNGFPEYEVWWWLNRNAKLVIQPDEVYEFAHFDNYQSVVNSVLNFLSIANGRLDWMIIDPEIKVATNILVGSVGWQCHVPSRIGPAFDQQRPVYTHPASANYIGGGQLVECGSIASFGNYYGAVGSMYWLDSTERLLARFGTVFFASGWMDSIAVYRGNDRTGSHNSSYIEAILYHHPERENLLKTGFVWYRYPSLYHVYVWQYDNPFLGSFPTTGSGLGVRIVYPYLPVVGTLGYFLVCNDDSVIGSARFHPGYYRLILPFEGWRKSLPAGIIRRIPDPVFAHIRYGTFNFLDREVLFMRRIVTMGNVPVILYPRFAQFPNRVVYYFTQDGGRCPLWMGEPIVRIDGFPSDTGKITVSVFTLRGIISFRLTIDGVEWYSWKLSPVPTWYSQLLGW